jgi:hypothetical protein
MHEKRRPIGPFDSATEVRDPRNAQLAGRSYKKPHFDLQVEDDIE